MTTAEIARRALAEHLAALPAGELLSRYASRRDPEAFAGLVHQFGPMVLGACRRVLGPTPDADDAFQAVFLALARQAGSFRDARALPAWLHRVAIRTSRKALSARRAIEPTPADATEPADPADPFAGVAWRDARRVLDEEIDALAEKLRGPVVLCWLDGLTQDEAAGKLGLSLNTLKRRLDAGRALLRSRLTRRGLAPALAAAAVLDPTGLRSAVPDSLATLAVELGVGGAVPERVGSLEVLTPTSAPTRRAVLATLLGAGAAAAGGIVYALTPPRRLAEPETRPPEKEPEPRPGWWLPRGRIAPEGASCVAFSLDGKTLATGGEDGTIRLWDVATYRELATLRGHQRAALSIAFSPDGKTLASGGADDTLRLWDVAAGREVVPQKGRMKGVFSVTFSPDGKTLAASCDDRAVRLWDVATGEERTVLPECNAIRIAFSPDGKTLATGGPTEDTIIWDLATKAQWVRVPPRVDDPGVLVFSPDGKTLTTFADKRVWQWDPRTGKERAVADGAPVAGTSAVAHPDGKTLVLGSEDGTVRFWDVVTAETRATFKEPAALAAGLSAVSPDGKTVASRLEQNVRLWDVTTGVEPGTLWGCSEAVAFSPDGKTLATAGSESGAVVLRLWDPATGRERAVFRGLKKSVSWLTFSPDGKTLASGSGNSHHFPATSAETALWDVGTGKVVATLNPPPRGVVLAATFSPDGKTLATGGSEDGTVRLWDTSTWEQKAVLPGNPESVGSVAFSKDGKTLAAAGTGDTVRLWDVGTRKERAALKDPAHEVWAVWSVAFSPDGKTLATAVQGAEPRGQQSGLGWKVWDVETGRLVAFNDRREGGVESVAYSPDGKTLAVGGQGPLELWDVASGQRRAVLRWHTRDVRVAFSPDGKTLATTEGRAGTVMLWDVTHEK
jgi:RNA polymerase sigma factor (sigma-70 family)